ncbi:MAG: iron chelate uptake ABC transporter family permease subunit [Flavobacteriales bacterium]
MQNKSKFIWILILLIGVCLLMIFINLWIGASSFKTLPITDSLSRSILLELRLPRAITALIVGGTLGVCGLILQTFFRNPLAGPSVLGITSGASLGVAIAVLGASLLPFLDSYSKSTQISGAILGALAVTLLLSTLAAYTKSTATLLIVGLMLSLFISAFISVLSLHTQASSLKDFAIWGMGSFSATNLDLQLGVFVSICLLICFVFWIKSSTLNVLFSGESYAQSMGINLKKTRLTLILSTAVSVGIITAFCGPIAFLGIATPHLIRLVYKNTNHYQLIPLCFLAGATLALLADFITKIPSAAYSLPLNSVLSLIGAPVIIYLILKKKAHLNL